MIANNPLANFDINKIPAYLSYEAMEEKYDFDLGENDNVLLGKGSFGKVSLFVNKNSRQEYAGKHMKCDSIEWFSKLLKEKIYQNKLNLMPGVMQLVEYFIWIDITKGN